MSVIIRKRKELIFKQHRKEFFYTAFSFIKKETEQGERSFKKRRFS